MTENFFLLALRSRDPSTILLRFLLKRRASAPLRAHRVPGRLKGQRLISVCAVSTPTVPTVHEGWAASLTLPSRRGIRFFLKRSQEDVMQVILIWILLKDL
jgi:hypothetical protein